MTTDAKFISIEAPEIGSIIVGMIMRPKPRPLPRPDHRSTIPLVHKPLSLTPRFRWYAYCKNPLETMDRMAIFRIRNAQ